MNIRFLKKLRREAHKKYGIQYNDGWACPYSVGRRVNFIDDGLIFEIKDFSKLEEAKKFLFNLRYEFIQDQIYSIRNKKKIEKYCKEISEL